LQRLHLLTVLAHLGVDLLQVLIDLVRVVPAHHLGELTRRGVFEEVTELGIDIGLHGA
jgi:hypothetical protein